ncbi:HTH luxR-type domain-containing protein [Mycobacterium sp. smrl_JER01]
MRLPNSADVPISQQAASSRVWRCYLGRVLVGRSAELAVVTELLARISTSGEALVLVGEPGIGKSTLLAYCSDWAVANGFERLACAGLQCHSEVGFAALHELLHPLLPRHLEELPVRQRSALMTAFGLAVGPAPDRLLIGLAVLGLLEEAASARPLLVTVDDAQWLDQSSLEVLTFVARRLTNAPLMLLCAVRQKWDGTVAQLSGLPQLPVGPLQPEAAVDLLTDTWSNAGRGQPMDPYAQRRVLDQADGNPLALIELTTALTTALADSGDLAPIFAGDPLPTTRRIEQAFLTQLEALPEQSRLLLLVIATSNGLLDEIAGAAGHLGLDMAHTLAPLELSGLVRAGGGRLRIRHPLVSSTVYGAAPSSERSIVHRAIAAVTTDATRAAWHRAEATFGPDAEVAADLDRAARRSRSLGAGPEAAAAFRRAAGLSPEPADRLRRLAAAAEVARSSGLIGESLRMVREAQSLIEDHHGLKSSVAITQFVLNVTADTPGQSSDELLMLATKHPEGDPRQRELLWAAAIACRMHGLPEQSRQRIAETIRRLDTSVGDPMTDIAAALVDDVGQGAAFRARLPELMESVGDSPLVMMSLAFAAEAVTDRRSALRCWTHVQSAARKSGSPADECEGLRGAAQMLITEGRIGAAVISAETALRMAEDMSLPITAGSAAAILARALVWQGKGEQAQVALTRARQLLISAPTIVWNDDAHWAAGMAALCESDHAEALEHLLKMGLHRTSRRWAVADLAEAAAGCDELDAARSVVEDVAAQAEGLQRDSALVHRARALLANSDSEVEGHFMAAFAAADGMPADLETARTHLLFGEWLRRRRRIVEARTHLLAALNHFEDAGAVPFAARAAGELRAAGVTKTPRAAAGAVESLTPQELQIAQMAAAGLTNREIADRIYLSHRTVATHLYKAFPKLGITRRNQLHLALGEFQSSVEQVI